MNILVLTSAYPQPDDGNAVITPTVKKFSSQWAQNGNRVVVIHNSSKFPWLYYMIPSRIKDFFSSKAGFTLPGENTRKEIHLSEENGKLEVYRLPIDKFIPHMKCSKRAIDRQLNKIITIIEQRNFKPDIIAAHWVNPQIQLLIPLREKYNAISSLVFHTDYTNKNIKRFDLTETIKKIDAIGCRNQKEAEEVQKIFGLKKKPFICYSGLPGRFVDNRLLELDNQELSIFDNHFLFVGRLVQYKNVDTIIRALKLTYSNEDFTLDIVGEGADRIRLTKLADELGVGQNVNFFGQKTHDEVWRIMKKASCFIMVSDNETFGMVYIEAMLAGCITVASKGGGVDGIIKNGQNGFLSTQGDEKELSNVIQTIRNLSNEEVGKMRRNAIDIALEYSDSTVAEKYINDVIEWKKG